jgi:hypothetical protein
MVHETEPGPPGHPEPIRSLPVPGLWGYARPLNPKPGATVALHLAAPAAFDVEVLRLGRRALLDPSASEADDRRDVDILLSRHHERALPGRIHPGSYVYVDGPPVPRGALSMAAWVRLWRTPPIDEIQWAASGIISDFDYPTHCRFALLVDHNGRLGLYCGGGDFRQESMWLTDLRLGRRLGEWVHVACSISDRRLRVFLDGTLAAERAPTEPLGAPTAASRLRLGAMAEGGEAADFLDGDLAQPLIAAFEVTEEQVARLAADRARTDPRTILGDELLAYWPLTEERGDRIADHSGHGRHGRIVNGGTWQIGGPAFDASRGKPGYDPVQDPDRGHGLRLSSDDLLDCQWPTAAEWTVPPDADSGLYAFRVRLIGQDSADALTIPFVVSRTVPRRPNAVALLCATNTWIAYGRRPAATCRISGLTASFYSTHDNGRPFFSVSALGPLPRANPYGYESTRAARTRSSHLVRPERFAEAWLAREGYAYEVITDFDLHAEPELLGRFACLMIVGHNEYWTDAMRDGILAYLRAGGRVLSLSGNTGWWRTSIDPERPILESRKTTELDDPRWLSPAQWGERWHSTDGKAGGTWQLVGAPGWQVLGLDTQGMIDDGAPTAFAPIRIVAPAHDLLTTPELVPLEDGQWIGTRCLTAPKASGYEFDATPDHLGLAPRPSGLEVIGSADNQPNLEWNGVLPNWGADIIWWERPDGGTVFAVGSIAATGALPVDPGLAALTRNVLARFGVAREVDEG